MPQTSPCNLNAAAAMHHPRQSRHVQMLRGRFGAGAPQLLEEIKTKTNVVW
jgi:hypothetical protein